jgi:hypothetical protein
MTTDNIIELRPRQQREPQIKDFSDRILRIKLALERINQLMAKLKEQQHDRQQRD